jgi:hypothetical protein
MAELEKTCSALYSAYLPGPLIEAVCHSEQHDFGLVSDVLWELLPEVGPGCSKARAPAATTAAALLAGSCNCHSIAACVHVDEVCAT